jgi:hypothetical protein
MTKITITHTPAEGTLVGGSRKGDGVWEILRELRGNGQGNWRSSRDIGLYLGQSRDKDAQQWKIDKAAGALRAAGFEVQVTVDNGQARSFADAEAERYERAGDRAVRHYEAGQNASGRADARFSASHAITGSYPMGQPVLVGHHSEGRHRRDLERADSHMRKGIEELGKAEYHAEREAAAERYQAGREDLGTTLRRIEGLEADLRRTLRRLAGKGTISGEPAQGGYREDLKRYRARLEEQLAYWRAHVAKLEAAGRKVWGRADFAKGDLVREQGNAWHRVLRVNAKSLTVPHWFMDGVTMTLSYDKVTGKRAAAEAAEAAAEPDRPAGTS